MALLRPSKWTLQPFDQSGARADHTLMAGGTLTLFDPQSKPQPFYYGRSALSLGWAMKARRLDLPKMCLPDLSEWSREFNKENVSSGAEASARKQSVSTLSRDTALAQVDKEFEASASHESTREKPDGASKDEDKAKKRPTTGIGTIFMTHAFMGSELNQSDLRGAAVYVQPGPDVQLIVGQRRSAMLLGINSAELIMGLSTESNGWLAERAIAQARALMLIDGTSPALASDGLGIVIGYLN